MLTPEVTSIAPGTVGADFVAQTAAIDAWLDANHARFVVRYIAGGGAWKHITVAEAAHHHGRGIAVVLNFEGSATDYTGGAARGAINGARARLAAQQLGYPAGLPLIVSVDTGLASSALALATAYVRAFFTASAPYTSGLYGPVNLYHQVQYLAPVFWLPNATSWQLGLRPTDVVHVRQRRSLHPPGVDPNTATASFPAWLPQPAPPPVPTPLPIDPVIGASGELMLYCYIDANGTVWVGNGLARRAVADMTLFAQYVALSTSGGGPRLVSGSGVPVRGIADVATVGAATIDALGKPI